MAKILILNGPNLNMLGTRQPEIYGDTKLQDIEAACQALASKLHMVAECVHSNHEGELVSLIQQASGNHDGIILNAGGYSHTSVAIRDALALFSGKIIEVHISNIYNREEFRHISMLSAVSDGVIVGLGGNSYTLAIRALAELIYDD
tara:strand:+ start:50 stop:490 length:441 start_codon:yes stop_codon:yes gene_type:complete